jgi:hypothetical protein
MTLRGHLSNTNDVLVSGFAVMRPEALWQLAIVMTRRYRRAFENAN